DGEHRGATVGRAREEEIEAESAERRVVDAVVREPERRTPVALPDGRIGLRRRGQEPQGRNHDERNASETPRHGFLLMKVGYQVPVNDSSQGKREVRGQAMRKKRLALAKRTLSIPVRVHDRSAASISARKTGARRRGRLSRTRVRPMGGAR